MQYFPFYKKLKSTRKDIIAPKKAQALLRAPIITQQRASQIVTHSDEAAPDSTVSWEEINEIRAQIGEIFNLVQSMASKDPALAPSSSASPHKEIETAPPRVVLRSDNTGKNKENPKVVNVEEEEEETILLSPTKKKTSPNPLSLKIQGLEESLRNLHGHDTFGLTFYDELYFFPTSRNIMALMIP